MTEAEARAVLQTEEAQDRLERLKDWVHMRTRQAEQDDAAVRGMAGRAYIILRLRAVIEDPAAPPAAKVNALDKLGKFYGMWDARAEPVRDLEGVTTEKLVELGRGVAAQAAKPKKPDEH